MRNIRTSLITFLFVVVASCGGADDAHVPKSDGLTFFHMNDTYRIGTVESGAAGGFGRVVTLIREVQQQGRTVRILHGGDFLYPSLESQLWHGEQMIDAFNYMDDIAPMYLVAGNHEFDRRTPEYLADAVRLSRFDWLGDNYSLDTGDEAVDGALKQAFTFEHGGRTVGIFALTLHPDDGGNARDYVTVDRDYVGIAKRTISELEAAGADLIIGLTHLHMEDDLEVAGLKAAHPKFLFVVGGHEHEPEFAAARETSAAVMRGASNARIIWRVDVDFLDDGTPRISDTHLTDVNDGIPNDPGYDKLYAKWRDRLLAKFPFLTARVGEAAVPLDGREVTIRNEESNWGSFVVDQMRGAFGSPAAELAFINSGTLRIDDWIAGDIRFEDIGRTFGFSSFLRHLTLTGREFRDVLEAGYRGEGPSKGYFPQVSGFRVCVDRSRPDGDRIVSLQLPHDGGWREIESDREHSVVVPDYLYRGGDGYRFPEHQQASRPGSELKYLVLDAIMAAQAQGEKVGAPVDPQNPRIVILGNGRSDCWP